MLLQSVDVLSSVEVLTHLKQWIQQSLVSCFCCSTSATHFLWLVVSAWTDPEEFSFPLHRELCGAQNPPGNMLLGFGTIKNLSYCYSMTQTPWESTPASLNMWQMSQMAQIEPNTEFYQGEFQWPLCVWKCILHPQNDCPLACVKVNL